MKHIIFLLAILTSSRSNIKCNRLIAGYAFYCKGLTMTKFQMLRVIERSYARY